MPEMGSRCVPVESLVGEEKPTEENQAGSLEVSRSIEGFEDNPINESLIEFVDKVDDSPGR